MTKKYPRISHFPFSPGITNSDKKHDNYWDKIENETLLFTEKLDGENTCLNQHGVYARSHSKPTQNPWANYLKPIWSTIKHDLQGIEIFGENLYAIHSIEYSKLEHFFYVFAVREKDTWLNWEEVEFYASMFDFPTVPLDKTYIQPKIMGEKLFELVVKDYSTRPSALGEKREGLVVRVQREFHNNEFEHCVLKWVRQNHVQTDEHWKKNWKKASLTKK